MAGGRHWEHNDPLADATHSRCTMSDVVAARRAARPAPPVNQKGWGASEEPPRRVKRNTFPEQRSMNGVNARKSAATRNDRCRSPGIGRHQFFVMTHRTAIIFSWLVLGKKKNNLKPPNCVEERKSALTGGDLCHPPGTGMHQLSSLTYRAASVFSLSVVRKSLQPQDSLAEGESAASSSVLLVSYWDRSNNFIDPPSGESSFLVILFSQ